MTARIYKPARTAMQSGQAKTKEWVLDYEPEQPRSVEPLMGWTSSGDMKQQVRITLTPRKRRSPIASATASLSGVRNQAAGPPETVLFGQFCLSAPRSLDALRPRGPL